MDNPLTYDFNHKYVIQSYIFTTAKYDYSIYEKRIIYRLIEYAQEEIEGLKIKDNLLKVHHNQSDVSIAMPIASILVPGEENNYNKNYAAAKKACKALGTKFFEWEDAKGTYRGDNIVYNIEINKGSGIMKFHVVDWIWEAILDFSKGFRKFDLPIAMKLRSVYSMRFFEIMSGQNYPLELSLNEIRKMFRLEDKYKDVNDFQRRVLRSAREELDRVSPYSFEFIANYVGKKIVSFTFYPIFIAANQDEKLVEIEQMAKVTARLQLDTGIYDYLKISYGFKSEEINKNKKLLIEGQKTIVNFLDYLANLRPNAIHARNPKAYIIGAIQRTLQSSHEIKNAKRQGSNYHSSNNAIKDRVYQLALSFKRNI